MFNWFSIRKVAVSFAVIGVLVGTLGVSVVIAKTLVSEATVGAFQPAGSFGGGVLNPGDFFPPTTNDNASLKRGQDWIQVNINTSGLPAGAYTVWWVIWNKPEYCNGPCDGDDINNAAAENSVFWATGGVVQGNGIGNFVARYNIGDSRGDEPGQDLINHGGIDPESAEIHNVIKYHGPASDDRDVLYEQTHTVFGSCNSGANANGENACFDPQSVVHPQP
jgi:hypothetical protein